MDRKGRYTLRETKALDAELGAIYWVEVTEFGDAEPMFVPASPRCEYCGTFVTQASCVSCGAGIPAGLR